MISLVTNNLLSLLFLFIVINRLLASTYVHIECGSYLKYFQLFILKTNFVCRLEVGHDDE